MWLLIRLEVRNDLQVFRFNCRTALRRRQFGNAFDARDNTNRMLLLSNACPMLHSLPPLSWLHVVPLHVVLQPTCTTSCF